MKFNCLLLLCMALLPIVNAIQINEILFNPMGSDTTEFVEIIGTNNLTPYFIGDASSNDSLSLLQFYDSNFSLIVTDAYNYSGLNCSVYSAGSSIGNHLNNDQDTIYLYEGNFSNNTLIDIVRYTNTYPEGFSLALMNNSWTPSAMGGTPCLDNGIVINESINVTNNTNTTTNDTNISINTTQNYSNFTNTSNNSCTISISISTEKELYGNKEQITFYNHVNTTQEFMIVYWVEDLFGTIIKQKVNTTNDNKKTFTPNIEEKDKVFIFKNQLVSSPCTLIGNESSTKMIIITNPEYTPSCPVCSTSTSKTKESSCAPQKEATCPKPLPINNIIIESFYTRAEKTNQNITLFANIKANTSKEFSLYSLQKISDLFVNDKASISVFAKPGKNIFLFALTNGSKLLEGNLIEIGENTANTTIQIQEQTQPAYIYKPTNVSNDSMTGKTIYSSPLGKVKNYLNYGLVFVAILGILVFIWSKKHGQKRQNLNQTEARRGLGPGQSHIRDGGVSQGTHPQNTERIHRTSQTKQGNYYRKRRKLAAPISQGGQTVEHLYGDGDAR